MADGHHRRWRAASLTAASTMAPRPPPSTQRKSLAQRHGISWAIVSPGLFRSSQMERAAHHTRTVGLSARFLPKLTTSLSLPSSSFFPIRVDRPGFAPRVCITLARRQWVRQVGARPVRSAVQLHPCTLNVTTRRSFRKIGRMLDNAECCKDVRLRSAAFDSRLRSRSASHYERDEAGHRTAAT